MRDSVDDLEDVGVVFGRNDIWTPYEIAKTIICSIFLLPIRFAVLILTSIIFSIVARISIIGISSDHLSKYPLSPKRRKLINFALALGFWKIKVTGRHLPRNTKVQVYVSNHTSWVDVLAIIHSIDDVPSFVAKRTIESIPFLGYDAKATQCIFMDRLKNKEGAGISILERASNFEMPPVVVFPEGTTSNGKQLIKFHTGAFLSGTPVRPIVIKYPYKHFSPAWDSISALRHIFRLLTQFSNNIEVIFLPVYVPSEEEKVNPELYAKKVQKIMADALRVPMKDYSYDAKLQYLRFIKR